MKTIGHLLGFELKRIKWLIVAAWVFLLMAFTPRILDGLGWWNWKWIDTEEFYANVGRTGFGLAGFFMSLWSALLGRKLFPARPVLPREARVVGLGVLFGVLVVPVVVLTWFSLWLYGFSAEVVWRNVGGTGLAVAGLWFAVCFFAKYAGSLKVMIVGMIIVGGLVILAEDLGYWNLGYPWGNVVGSFPEGLRWLPPMTAGLLMAVCWKWLKQRGVVPRMTVAISAVVAGWVFAEWARGFRNERGFAKEFAGEVKISGTAKDAFYFGKAGLIYDQLGGFDDEMIVWEVDGALVDKKGRHYVNFQNKESKIDQVPISGVRGIGRNWIARSLVNEGWIYLDAQNRDEVVYHDRNRHIEVNLPKDYSRGEEVELSGRLVGKRYRVDCLVDRVPFGEEAEFWRGDVLGAVERRKRYSGDQEELHLEVTMPLLGDPYEKDYRRDFDENWIYQLSYPESRVVSEGRSNFRGSDEEIGGVKRRSVRMEFRNMNWRRFVRKGEKPLLSIYRVVVEEVGHVEVNSEPLVLIPEDVKLPPVPTLETKASLVSGPPSTPHWKRRPHPIDGNREEVGAWLRELSRKHYYAGKRHDLAQYAEIFGGLFLEPGTRDGWYEREAFIDGATDDWSEVAVEELGDAELVASVLVERGWVGEVKEKVATLIEEGSRKEEVLRLGILLGLEGIEEAVLEGLVSSDSWLLYEAARTRMDLEVILDDRLQRVDDATQRVLFQKRGDFRFDSTRWLWLLHEGRREDLERCLFWMRKAHESGQIDDRNDDYSERLVFKNVLFDHEQFQLLAEQGKLQAKFFTWDPVLRRWNFNEEGMTK